MSSDDTRFAWWSRLRHSGLLLSPVVQIEKYSEDPEEPQWYQPEKLRTAYNRFLASIDRSRDRPEIAQADVLKWADALLGNYVGHDGERLTRSHSIPESLTAVIRIGSRTETLRPDRVLFADDGKTPLLLVKADTSPHIGRGKGRTEYARFLELLRGSGQRLGLLTNGLQFRLVYAGLDFESWCEWESERWFEDAEGTEELLGLRQMLFPNQAFDDKGEVVGAGLPGLLTAVEESRKRQADLSQVLRENVRQAIELLLEDVSNSSRTEDELLEGLFAPESSGKRLTDSEAHEALLQATVRVVMRMVVCLFAESRGLLPVNDPIYSQGYGVRTLYELLDETVRHEGGHLGLMSRQSAWARLMALYRLIHGGSSHGGFPLRPYGGALFRPGEVNSEDAVSRALFILEHRVSVNDATIYRVLRKLLRGPLPVLRGRSKTYVEGPVDYTDLRTEFIGLIYEGLLDYRLKRTDEESGAQVFLNMGRNPVLPLSVLEKMLEEKPKDVKELFDKLGKEKVSASVSSDEEEEEDGIDDSAEEEPQEEFSGTDLGDEQPEDDGKDQSYVNAVHKARQWAREAIVKTKRITAQRRRETDTEYDKRIGEAVEELIDRVVAPGEFYLVRAGNTRKGTGTFYTRPQLAVPTVHRTLQPLCYDGVEKGTITPKKPEQILSLKVCDPACGSASFLVAALHYLTDALFKSLCQHCGLDDPERAAQVTLPFGTPATGNDADSTLPLLPDDPDRGDEFVERIQALLRRHIVERCIYGVDINPLAVEFARVSLWVETLDPELPFSFLDHKIRVGNALVGCWLDRFEQYPIKAWERRGGDDPSSTQKGEQTLRLETWLKGDKQANGRRSGDGVIRQLMRQSIADSRIMQSRLFADSKDNAYSVLSDARQEYEQLHLLPITAAPEDRERLYEQEVRSSPSFRLLKQAMDEWCSVWFWGADEHTLQCAPDPASFLAPSNQKSASVRQIRDRYGFFHWELEFPDVFTADRYGFDAVLGNPPWENLQPSPGEFFSDIDPTFRTLGRLEARSRIQQLFADIDGLADQWAAYCADFKCLSNFFKHCGDPFGFEASSLTGLGRQHRSAMQDWREAYERQRSRPGAQYPFRYQEGRLFTYKLFLEQAHFLLREAGRLGFIIPSGLYTDAWSLPLREFYLQKNSWEWLYCFENRKKIFDIHGSFKFAVVIIENSAPQEDAARPLRLAFMVRELHLWEASEPVVVNFDPEWIEVFSPHGKAIPEIQSDEDFEVSKAIYANAFRLGEGHDGMEPTFSLEFMMNSDARKFPPIGRWESNGFQPTVFGHWCKGEEVALPLYEGRMIDLYQASAKGWVSGKGRSAEWRDIPADTRTVEPQYLMSRDTYRSSVEQPDAWKIGYMRIASATNSRTMICCPVRSMPCGDTVATLRFPSPCLQWSLLAAGLFSSFTFDFVTRQRVGGLHLDWHIVAELPFPQKCRDGTGFVPAAERVIKNVARLTLNERRFAPDWVVLLDEYAELSDQEWKHWWAITEADRVRLRVEVEALAASLYGLSPVELDQVVVADPTNPKGFWRIDKRLPYEQRLTGLSSKAFLALSEGKWTADSAEQLSNDEFFLLLGVPELTSIENAKAKGHDSPLITRREGCHSWKPESFAKDDPRHGWTWEDCRRDAVTLLGSEESLEEYVARASVIREDNDDDSRGDCEHVPDPSARQDPQQRMF